MPNVTTTTISSNFIGNFKIGDNIAYNCDILSLLYENFDGTDGDGKVLLCKPIIILLVSIIDATLYDFDLRINEHVREGIRGLEDAKLEVIREENSYGFENLIRIASKFDLLLTPSDRYEDLHVLRKLRNRVHIQNKFGKFEPDECDAFNIDRKKQAEAMVYLVLQTMSDNYYREPKYWYNPDFELPWASE